MKRTIRNKAIQAVQSISVLFLLIVLAFLSVRHVAMDGVKVFSNDREVTYWRSEADYWRAQAGEWREVSHETALVLQEALETADKNTADLRDLLVQYKDALQACNDDTRTYEDALTDLLESLEYAVTDDTSNKESAP